MNPRYLAISLAACSSLAHAQSFSGIGVLPGGTGSNADHISGDGLVVIGHGNVGPLQFHAFRWTAATGLEDIGALPGALNAIPRNASHNGSVIVGYSDAAFRWTRSTGMLPLQSSPLYTDAYGISADGAVVVGYIDNFPFRWTQAGGYETLGILPGGFHAAAWAVSGDGNVIAGTSFGGGDRPFIWTRAGGMQPIGYLGSGFPLSTSEDISTDGTTIVGNGYDGSAARAFRWRSSSGLQDIGILSGKTEAEVHGTNADGSVTVGVCWSNQGENTFTATMWSDSNGVVDLNIYLPAIGINLAGWNLTSASDVSDDGMTIAGYGIHNGVTEAWVATLGCRSDFNADGTVDIFDYFDFVAAFAAEETAADFNNDGLVDFFDYLDFLLPFSTGC